MLPDVRSFVGTNNVENRRYYDQWETQTLISYMEKYKCSVCGYVYDPEEGDCISDIRPGIAFSDLPDEYVCPVCGAGKEEFYALD